MTEFFEQNVVLENNRVKLVPFSEEHREGLLAIACDDSIWTYMGMTMKDEKELDTYIENTVSERKSGKSYPFVIIDKETNEVAGSTRFGNIHFHNMRLEIGWTWYGKKFQGTGLNHACKYALLSYVFEEMTFNRVQFSADLENIRSQKAILKLGATKEGVFRHNYVDEHGQKRDDVYFSIVADEWERLKREVFQ
ncbi:GNAT family N-acetyltransferase [Metabacillus iocasae]|uniref:RimJ/RimL family protein N-acetyltransferase n=1 Tax=Priestia iocasae TaxID=2291674 RepID=A0ABS2QVR3_9BACI|nr:GNAT family N-acetyltransferase [Metabacillus iocasae]MBM7703490.1 RimJ/RimL family protein N-acetyltransferase [Metabacillus iocasae]